MYEGYLLRRLMMGAQAKVKEFDQQFPMEEERKECWGGGCLVLHLEGEARDDRLRHGMTIVSLSL